MTQASQVSGEARQPLTVSKRSKKKPLQLIENNYHNNLASDYTEKIEELDKNFDYRSNAQAIWSNPELSLLYGTPLYEATSPAQKLALNHLAWVAQYNHIANSETETVHYNQITAGCLAAMGQEYEAIAHQLEHEADQERSHIHAFYKVGYQTMKALLGKQAFIGTPKDKSQNWQQSSISMDPYPTLRFVTKTMLRGKEAYHSPYLDKLEAENKLPTSTNGFFHGRGLIPQSLLKFFAFNWGSSPFLACQYYTLRLMANMLLKSKEHSIFLYCKKLQKQGEWIPAPTAISHYHFLDESFHTTTSLFLACDFYRYLPKPTAYEKFVVNVAVYFAQQNNLQGLSGGVMSLGDDASLMAYVYKLLQSPLFEMSAQDALQWVEKCFCHEHEGFHLSSKLHQRLLSELRRHFEDLDYLWAINRDMRIMAAGGSIAQAIQHNTKIFEKFSKSVA